jgi:hypothetical protein
MELTCSNDNFLGHTYMVCAVQPVQIFLAHCNSCTGVFSHKMLHNHQFQGYHIAAAEYSSSNNVTLCHWVSGFRCCGRLYRLHLQRQDVQDVQDVHKTVNMIH